MLLLAVKLHQKSGRSRGLYLAGLLLILASLSLDAQTYLDNVIFGNSTSETIHAFFGPNTTAFNNSSVSPAQSYRRGMTNNPATIYGAPLTFNLAVDPLRRNYFTVKLWGGDEPEGLLQDADMGRLYLYVAATNFNAAANPTNFFQVGYRHEGDYSELNTAGYKPPLPNRFFYPTTLLPLWMTQGRTNLTLTIQPGGRIYDLGSGGPPGGNYQFNMFTNSRGIYQAYTHTDPVLNPVGEVQGSVPTATIRPASPADTSSGFATMSSGGAFWNLINGYYGNLLSKNVTNYGTWDVSVLAMGYWVTNFPSFYTNATVLSQVTLALDYYASNYYAGNSSLSVSSGGNNGWGGNYGYLGWAIDIMLPKLTNVLDVLPGIYGTNVSRRQAWGEMLLASREYGRTNRDAWNLSNQNLIANRSIYWANRGLLDLTNVNAFAETNAQRYLLEAIGIQPWLGSDLSNGGHSYSYGTNYFMVSPKGLTHEFGYAGTSYGEMQYYAAEFYEFTTNVLFLNQCVKMAKARAYFRRPTVDMYTSGSTYQAMEAIGIMAWRGADESDTQFADDITYGERTLSGTGMRIAAATMDTNLIGYAKQMLSDGQYFYWLQKLPNSSLCYEWFKAFSDYQKVSSASDSGVRLPFTTNTQPDFAWADEDNGIVAIKRGNERLWLSTYWQAHAGTGINGLGRFLYETNNFDRYGDLEVTPQFTPSGNFYPRPNMVDLPYKTVYQPPDNPSNAYTGELLPQAALPPLATSIDPFVGKANFWSCRYGNFLIGINRSDSITYQLPTPSNFSSATNLVTGQNMSGTINVAPQSTVVLYLTNTAGINPVPQTPLWLNAVGISTPLVMLNWTPSSGALGYNVKRSTTSGGPYTTIAKVTATNFTDTSVTIGGNYYYVVTGTNSYGESLVNSMEASASTGLPPPWNNLDIGTPNLPGNSDYSNGVFMVTGNGFDIGGSSDSFQYAYTSFTNNSGSFIVRLASMQLCQSAEKVGVMMRSSTNANAMTAVLMFDTDSGFHNVRFACRTSNGGGMSYSWDGSYIVGAPVWFMLQRTNGATYTGYFSNDGSTWTPVGTNTISSMTGTILAGMCVCARYNVFTYDTTVFDNVSLTGWPLSASGVPTTLVATAGYKSARLKWNPATNATSYNVKRANISGGPYSAMGSSTTTNYVDGGLTNGTTYYYVVSALNGAGESANSTETNATPVAVSGVGVVISVNFQGGSANNGYPSAMTGTEYAGQVVANNWNNAAGTVGIISSLAQSDGSITPASVTWACNNTWSTAITESPGDLRMMKGYLDNSSTTNTVVTISNLPPTFMNNGYSVYVYCDGDNGSTAKTGVYTIGTITNKATDSANANFSGTYVQANNSTGNYVVFTNLTTATFNLVASTSPTDGSSGRSPVNAIQVVANTPTAPTGLTAVAGSAQVTLNWNATVGATSYNLNRTLTSGSNYVTVSSVAGTNTVDSGLSNGTNYYYVVSAVNGGGESTNSVQVSARPTSMISPPLQMSLNAGQLQFTWPPDHTGWRLVAQTNSLNTGLGSNWFTVGSSTNVNQMSVPIIATNGSVFYRLVYP